MILKKSLNNTRFLETINATGLTPHQPFCLRSSLPACHEVTLGKTVTRTENPNVAEVVVCSERRIYCHPYRRLQRGMLSSSLSGVCFFPAMPCVEEASQIQKEAWLDFSDRCHKGVSLYFNRDTTCKTGLSIGSCVEQVWSTYLLYYSGHLPWDRKGFGALLIH